MWVQELEPNEGADNQLFTASASHIQDVRCVQPDSGFTEPANNNISEDNNNGPISLREMQNIANNNAAAYIVSENEERNRISRESVVEFEPLPVGLRVVDPLERCADWFGDEDFPRNQLQYLREIGRGWFGRVVEGELEGNTSGTVAVKILNQNANLEEKARFLDEAKIYRDARHENILAYVAKCLQEDPWILLFELCSMDLQQYLILNRPKMAILNESGVPLQLMCDVTSALAYLHSRGILYGEVWSDAVLVRGSEASARAVLGRYVPAERAATHAAPEARRQPPEHTSKSEVWSLGTLIWEICAWGSQPPSPPPPLPDLPCPYRTHLYQVMQLCWNPNPDGRPSAAQVHALLNHLHSTHIHSETAQDDGYGSSDFEERWQRLKPNTIPKIDEHVAIVHAPSTSMTSHFTGSDQEFDSAPTMQDTLSVDLDTAVSRSSSIMSDKDSLPIQMKSESLNNLHGSLDDVRNIYLTHNETAAIECHQGNVNLDDNKDKDNDHSDSSMDPWLKDIITGSQDDVSYYKDVSDVIKNLDNILNSEKTSSSESSHQASPSRDNLSLECKKDYPVQKSMVKSPGISNFQNILEIGFDTEAQQNEACEDDDVDRDTIGTLSHSFERHSDSISQHTLENLTPETPIKDLDVIKGIEIEPKPLDKQVNIQDYILVDIKKHSELPNDNKVDHSISHIPMLKELCEAAMPSASETIDLQLNVREDCHTPCDNKLTDVKIDFNNVGNKSVDDITILVESEEKSNTESATLALITEMESTQKMDSEIQNQKSNDQVLPESEKKITETNKENVTALVINDIFNESKKEEIRLDLSIHEKLNIDFKVEEHNEENTSLNIEISPKIAIRRTEECSNVGSEQIYEADKLQPAFKLKETPEIVQNLVDSAHFQTNNANSVSNEIENIERTQAEQILPPELVQNNSKEFVFNDNAQLEENVNDVTVKTNDIKPLRSDINVKAIENVIKEPHSDSTVYMDLINYSNNEFCKDNHIYSADVVPSYFESSKDENETNNGSEIVKNESTAYLELPSVIKETDNFLHSERTLCSQTTDFKDVVSSTPKGSDSSVDALETSTIENEYDVLSETKVPECDPGVTLIKLEQICVPDSLSPLESPTKSHHTDTYDENSSVVLGPFENCTLELFKAVKSEIVDLPKEELLAFSSNFSEIDLETPSPLRDGNFLNEVPDIVHDDLHFDDVVTVSEAKTESIEGQSDNTENTEEKSNTEKHISPSTPPNSPGIFLASTSQQKYLVEIDLSTPNESVPHTSASIVTDSVAPQPSDSGLSSLQKEIDLNQIELQITTKLAIAENENNLNIEYSGPLTVEGFVTEDEMLMRESDAMPESYLAGNGRRLEGFRELNLDEECVQALRNELELKLPLAQVAGIEPAGDTSGQEEVVAGDGSEAAAASAWSGELPPPPELLLSYPPALSPIAEETGQQLSAYENDTNWNLSNRTESSESYPEPCNNSTDEVTDLPTGVQSETHEHSTYTIQSRENSPNNTYTVQREIGSSKEMTMSADSLNASPFKKLKDESLSPIDDKTYNKNDDEKLSNCERLSQVSPFLLSPTTDTSAPDNSDNNAGCSTLSKPTVPTDAKSSKPSETQCLSKATSIDSWCSNDTLYNVEENFDDLAMDPDMPLDFEPDHEPQKDDKSESTDTLTHNEEEKELSHCSTYIIHDSKSDMCETFSPDSITANDNNTYTKAKTEAAGTTPSVNTKSELNDSTKNTQTKDLAYGTLMSGLPSNSNCTTEVPSIADEVWKLTQPELVRRSPFRDDFNFTPPNFVMDKECSESGPKTKEPKVNRMDSVEVTCLKDNSDSEIKSESESQGLLVEINDSQDYHYRNMAHSVTSTPLAEIGVENDNMECIPIKLPEIITENSEYLMNNLPNFQTFFQSAEIRPQDISSNISKGASSNQDTEILLEGESKSLSRNSNKDSLAICDRTPTYADFENSATSKPQDLQSREKSRSFESSTNSEDFRGFENSVRNRPQDLSSLIDASSLLLKSERRSSELAMESISNLDRTNRSENLVNNVNTQSLVISPPNTINLNESHIKDINRSVDTFITDLDMEEETEQPHSIIITESPLLISKSQSPNITYDSHIANMTYNSHEGSLQSSNKENTQKAVTSIQPHSIIITESPLLINKSQGPNITYDYHTVNMTYNSHEGSLQPSNKENTQKSVTSISNVNGDETYVIPNEHKQSPEPDISNDITSDIEPKTAFSLMDHQTVKSDSPQERVKRDIQDIKCNGDSKKYATVSFLNESFEELLESNVDDNDSRDFENDLVNKEQQDLSSNTETAVTSIKDRVSVAPEEHTPEHIYENIKQDEKVTNGISDGENEKITSLTDDFLQNEKKFCQLDSYLPLLSDIRFTGPGTETMSTAFNQELPTEPTSPECEQDSKPDTATEILKEWESDSDSHSTNSSSGEFIWKGGDGHETSVVPSTHFDHQREDGSQGNERPELSGSAGNASSGSEGSEGSEGDEVEFVPSSWDCRAAPAKSSLRSLEQAAPDNKKRVVFKRQKYHCVYEYPREVADVDAESPAFLPDFSTYSEWDPTSAEDAEIGYGELFGAPNPLNLFPRWHGPGADYDEDFFITSSARPFESLGVMSTTSQFFPGMHVKPSLLERDIDDLDDFPPPPSPLPPTTLVQTRTPSLDFTTPDSGVEDITPGSTSTEDDFKTKKVSDNETCWRPVDSASSSESVSPSSPGGEALGGLRHTRDKLKLDLPPSPHIPSPRHNRVFNFVLDKPKRRTQEERTEIGTTPLVMTDETPIITTSLPLQKESDDVIPEPTFSTFGKCASKNTEPEQKAMILTDDVEDSEIKEESSNQKVEPVKGEGTVLDSGDEDSGIESSSKATLERNKSTPNIS
ncbi:unnamed protein product [Parnassius apollo]|uniref:(apollo) hypothetical protein n=1 Tax=Parnassius apollo TaxID=110799 RepID=A0A8S3Y2G3_PARAO|nr:unnamed protein product [Parnassius apollo]